MPSERLSWRDIRKTSAFRLTLLLGTAATMGMLALLVLIYNLTAQELNQRSDHVLHVEATRLSALPASALPAAIAKALNNNISGLNYFGLLSPDGQLLAGNLKVADLHRLDRPVEIGSPPDIDRPLRIIGHRTASGNLILIGRDIRPLADLRSHIFRILLASALLVIPLLLAASLILSVGPLRRVGRLQHVARTIGAGDLGARMPIRGRGDELDLFAATVNQMVAAVGRTVAEVKSVTDAIAHDLRTPLTHVRNQLYRISRAAGLEPADAARIGQSIDDLDFVIERFAALMRISELEAGARTGGFATLTLAPLARSVAELYAPLAEDRGIQLSLSLIEDVIVSGDEKLMFEAVSNLVDNAIKFTPEEGVVTLSVGLSGHRPYVEVRDNGPGVVPEHRETIVRRFERGSATTQVPGSGLGLSIVSAIVHLHHFVLEMEDASPGLIVRITDPRSDNVAGR